MTDPTELRDRLRNIAEMCLKHGTISAQERRVGEAMAFSYLAELAEIMADAVAEGVTP